MQKGGAGGTYSKHHEAPSALDRGVPVIVMFVCSAEHACDNEGEYEPEDAKALWKGGYESGETHLMPLCL